MKILNSFGLILLLVVAFTSCKKDKEESLSPEVKATAEKISAKWEVAGANSPYQSFEFNESGNYIIVQNSTYSTSLKSVNGGVVLYGTYKVIDSLTIALSDVGTVHINAITDSGIEFSLELEDGVGTTLEIVATKVAEMEYSERTKLLCRTWSLASIKIDGEENLESDEEFKVLFSEAGTYLVSERYYEEGAWTDWESDISQWTWKNSSEDVFCYSWDWESTVQCDGDNEVQITTLTSSKLVIVETWTWEENNTEVTETDVFTLVPYNGLKSVSVINTNSNHNNSLKRGFFKR